jgi:hypothetical protein
VDSEAWRDATAAKPASPPFSLDLPALFSALPAGNRLAFQEFFVVPTGAKTFSEAMQIGCEVFHNLKAVIKVPFTARGLPARVFEET